MLLKCSSDCVQENPSQLHPEITQRNATKYKKKNSFTPRTCMYTSKTYSAQNCVPLCPYRRDTLQRATGHGFSPSLP